jgi:hypothetical protein
VLLIESDTERRAELSMALQASGIAVVAVGCVADIERWPAGDVVVTESDRFTPWWTHVGATYVIVLADTAEQGADACERGATAWIPRRCTPDTLVGALRQLGLNHHHCVLPNY